ncbi:hypothetical protein DYB35_004243 [Aphanomyces astaci]|uniref:MOSC domain-containing protein n=1 Tax=Aphanomyces astaci TaxID=112090 RepID=A0A3R6XTW3_APHAT|nr:hypothetical protein DYB35_004243 [Aphanomyces astaci]
MEYALIGLAFVTVTASLLMPYLINLFVPPSSSADIRAEIEQAIVTARLDAASKRPNAYPPHCPVRTSKGDDAVVQRYNASLDTYTLTSSGVDVPASHVVATTVADLFIYPIKSCGGTRLTHSHVLGTSVSLILILSYGMICMYLSLRPGQGLQYDRQWLVVDDKGDFVTQRKYPLMALIQPHLTLFDPSSIRSANAITLTATNGALDPLVVPVLTRGVQRSVRVWKDRLDAIDQGDAAAAWLAKFLGNTTFRLVRLKDTFKRPCDPEFAPDHITVTAAASLTALEQKLDRPLDILRFRPNIVLAGCPAWADDVYHVFDILGQDGNLRFRNVKPCSRCSVPSVNPATGAKDDEVAGTISLQDVLKAHRYCRYL